MKKTFIIALSLIFAFSAIQAQKKTQETQEKKITDEEFKAVLQKSTDQTRGKSYRLKRASKTYKRADNSLSRYFNETTEYLVSGDSRSVLENASAGEKPMLRETIRIGQKAYIRLNIKIEAPIK